MGSKKIDRLTVYATGETISANEHNAEHQQYVDNFNELFKSFDYDGTFHYPLASKVKFEYTDLKLEDLLKVSVNPDGTIKAEKVIEPSFSPSNLKEFLSVAHNPDGTLKSDGIDNGELYAHNHDSDAHPEAFDKHNQDENAHPKAFNKHNQDENAHTSAFDKHNSDADAHAEAFKKHNDDAFSHAFSLLKSVVFGTYHGDYYQEIHYENGNPTSIVVYKDKARTEVVGSISVNYDDSGNPNKLTFQLDGKTIIQDIYYDSSGNPVLIEQTEA